MDIADGRLVTFPNLLFHTHFSLRLVDKTRDGHCKILTFLLVDPNIRVISSAIVPPQQFDWWAKEVTKNDGGLGMLPYELRLEIVKYVPAWHWGGCGLNDKASREENSMLQTRYLGIIDSESSES